MPFRLKRAATQDPALCTNEQKRPKYPFVITVFVLSALLVVSAVDRGNISDINTMQEEHLTQLLLYQDSVKKGNNSDGQVTLKSSFSHNKISTQTTPSKTQELTRKKRYYPHAPPPNHREDNVQKNIRLALLKSLMANSTFSPVWHYTVMYTLLKNIYRNTIPSPMAAKKEKLKHYILSNNQVYPGGKGGHHHFICGKESGCYQIDPVSGEIRHYICKSFICWPA